MPLGKCKLCLTERVQLQDSHLLPKAGYRLLQKSQGGAAPVLIKAVTMVKDEQVHAHVLCSNCEERFSDCGESWVLQNCNRGDEGFALHNLVTARPEFESDRLKVYAAAHIAGIDSTKLVYFAMSAFWRASAHDWKSGKDDLKTLKLGARYDEEFRQYLLGGEFPRNTTLQLAIVTDPNLWNVFFFPYGTREDGYTRVTLPYFGLIFTLWLGNLVPAKFRAPAFFPSPQNFIAMTPTADDMLITHAGKRMSSSRPIGEIKKVAAKSKLT